MATIGWSAVVNRKPKSNEPCIFFAIGISRNTKSFMQRPAPMWPVTYRIRSTPICWSSVWRPTWITSKVSWIAAVFKVRADHCFQSKRTTSSHNNNNNNTNNYVARRRLPEEYRQPEDMVAIPDARGSVGSGYRSDQTAGHVPSECQPPGRRRAVGQETLPPLER